MSDAIQRLKRFVVSRDGLMLLALFVVALVIRFPLMTFHGYYDDLATYIRWGAIVNEHFSSIYTTSTGGAGFAGGNGFGRGGGGFLNGSINYPPATPYLFGLVVFLYNHLAGASVALSVLVGQDGRGPFIAKLPLLLADLAALGVLYYEARRWHSERFALIVAGSYALSPALLYNGALWGQTDGLVALPILISLFAIVGERYAVGGVALALAIVLKPQPLIFVPLLLLYLWRWRDRRAFARFCIAGAVTLVVFLLPVLIPHFQLGAMLHNIQAQSYNDSSSLTSNAFNFWWLAGDSQQTIGTTILGITSGLWGDLGLAVVTLVCAKQIWRRREPVYLSFGLAVQIFGFFFLMGGQHERYLFLFVPLMAATIILARREGAEHLFALYGIGTALCFANMVVGVSSFVRGQSLPFLGLQGIGALLAGGFDAFAMLLAFAHLAAFCYALYVYVNDRFTPVERAAITSSPEMAPMVAEASA